MKKIININLSSRLIPIEDSAYDLLRGYLESLKKHFAQEDGSEEIMSDIESRIAEIFQEKLRKGAHCITDEDVQEIKASMGTPEQLEDEPKQNTQANDKTNAGFESYHRPSKRFYRDPEHKVLGGVCGGLGAYFNIDPVILRVAFVLLTIAFGASILVYLVIWIAAPSANTAAEKLEMRGEKVDYNNIKNTVQEEMKEFKSRMGNVGNDFRNFSQGRGKQFGSEIGNAFDRGARGLGRLIAFIAKSFMYFFAAVILITLIAVLVLSSFTAAFFPIINIALTDNQAILFWISFVLLLGIPIISLIMFLARRISGSKYANKYVGYSMGFFWVIGLICAITLATGIAKSVRSTGEVKNDVTLRAFKGEKLYIKKLDQLNSFDDDDFLVSLGERMRVEDDTTVVDAVSLKVVPGFKNQTNFELEIRRVSQGASRNQAQTLARSIILPLEQKDSILYLPAGFNIPTATKYRGQRVYIYVRVPNGKSVDIDRNALWNYNFLGIGRHYVNGIEQEYNNHLELKFENGRMQRMDDDGKPFLELSGDDDDENVIITNDEKPKDSVIRNYRYQENAPAVKDTAKPKKNATPVDNKKVDTATKKTLAFADPLPYLFVPIEMLRS
ncbi:phage shock protein C (PspC) family protein [Chitinophaga skermanii]|uniref:Phage shock protein C (PspC) family protein n=1 Tax=Chitinophaga skermanii TaxID=331697 RepID=A0A327QDX3_9BACT|nr:PspC domain-containing protein [Chitinophaga skermanii]RAJ01473.1 phage shock protein C (PspC) family protein [Chitinophaga skermanii]